jgi:hypothetical protein
VECEKSAAILRKSGKARLTKQNQGKKFAKTGRHQNKASEPSFSFMKLPPEIRDKIVRDALPTKPGIQYLKLDTLCHSFEATVRNYPKKDDKSVFRAHLDLVKAVPGVERTIQLGYNRPFHLPSIFDNGTIDLATDIVCFRDHRPARCHCGWQLILDGPRDPHTYKSLIRDVKRVGMPYKHKDGVPQGLRDHYPAHDYCPFDLEVYLTQFASLEGFYLMLEVSPWMLRVAATSCHVRTVMRKLEGEWRLANVSLCS